MKRSFINKGQEGFTLLELLVVITIIAALSVGAIVAYEGIGENAQATAASNNTLGADQAIRNFRAVTGNYPDQWDNLVQTNGTDEGGTALTAATAGGDIGFYSDDTELFLASFTLGGGTVQTAITAAFEEVGIETVQSRMVDDPTLLLEPNLQHNEGAVEGAVPGSTDVAELDFDSISHVAVLPSFGGAACTTENGTYPTTVLEGTTIDGVQAAVANKINDGLEDDECALVIAMGFGHDAAHSTNGSSVAISTAPTYVSKDINPNVSYARYIALFQVGRDGDGDDVIQATEVFTKARLIAVVDTEGHVIDENIASAADNGAGSDDD